MAAGFALLTVAKAKALIATHNKYDALSRPTNDEEKETSKFVKLEDFIKPVRKQSEKKSGGKEAAKPSTQTLASKALHLQEMKSTTG